MKLQESEEKDKENVDDLDLSLEVLASRIQQRNAELLEQSHATSNEALSGFQLDGSLSTVSGERRSPQVKNDVDRPKPLQLADDEGNEICALDTNPVISLPAEPVDEDDDELEFFLDDDEPLKKTELRTRKDSPDQQPSVITESQVTAGRHEKASASITSDLSHIAPMSFI